MLFTKAVPTLALAGAFLAPLVSGYAVGGPEFERRSVAEKEDIVRRQDVALALSNDEVAKLESAFQGLEEIPDAVLEEGDDAAHEWFEAHGYGTQGLIDPNSGASIWEITKCAGAIAAFVGGNLVAASKLLKIKKLISALGGFKKAAELMLKASTAAERLKYGGQALVDLAAEILGVSVIKNNCS